MNNSSEFINPAFEEAPFVEPGPGPTPRQVAAQNVDQRDRPVLRLFDPSVQPDEETMSTWQLIMCEISIIQRLEINPGVKDIVRMIKAAEKVQELAPQLVEDMKEHRKEILRELGVEVDD